MTANKELCFTVIEREITTRMDGHSKESHIWDCGDEFSLIAIDFNDMVSTIRKWAAKDGVEVYLTRNGVNFITRPVYEVYAWCENENGEFVRCDEYGDESDDGLVYMFDVLDLHPEYRVAWDETKRNYRNILDF